MSEQAEIQQAAATGAAAAVGAVADQQEVEARAEEAEAAAETSAQIAQVAAEASRQAAEVASAAVTEADASRTTAESAVQQAGAAQQEIGTLRSELSEVREGFGALTQAVRSLLDMQSKGDVVQKVEVDATPPEPTTDQGEEAQHGGANSEDSASERRKRHKFGGRRSTV